MQGVGFRWFVHDTASDYRLAGWVRNLYDGKVEVVFEGERRTVEAAIARCSEGPRFSSVSGIEVNWDEAPEDLTGFEIRH